MTAPILVLWWIPAGHIPSVDEAKEKLELLKASGPTAAGFTFRNPFPAPGRAGGRFPEVDAEFCEPPFALRQAQRLRASGT